MKRRGFFPNKKLPRTQDYVFREPKDGYLVFKRQYTTRVRRFLVFLRGLVKSLMDLREKNEKINREILDDLGLDSNAKVDQLDGFHKREFRKRKYVFFFGEKEAKDLREPTHKHFSFHEEVNKRSAGSASVEFFKSFRRDDFGPGEEAGA